MSNQIEQGGTFEFDFTLSGDQVEGFAPVFSLMQYPGDTPAISARAMTADTDDAKRWLGVLTAADTANLAVGRWWIHITASDTDENLRKRLYVDIGESWT